MRGLSSSRRVTGAAIVFAVSLAACGGSSSLSVAPVKHPPNTSKIVLDSVRTTTAEKSARVEMTLSAGGSGGLSTSLSGVTDFATGNSELTTHLSAPESGGSSGDLVERTVDHVTYLQIPGGLSGVLGLAPGAKWISMPSPSSGSAIPGIFPGFGQTDPTQMLAYLEAVSNDVKTVGTDQVRGVETTHYRALLDLGKAIDRADVPPSLRDDLKKITSLIAANPSAIPVDIWVDADGLVRRVNEHLDFADFGALGATGGGATGSTGADSAFTLTMSIDFYDFGVPVNVQAPPADQVVTLPSLGGLFGATGASGTSGPTS